MILVSKLQAEVAFVVVIRSLAIFIIHVLSFYALGRILSIDCNLMLAVEFLHMDFHDLLPHFVVLYFYTNIFKLSFASF